MSELIYSDPISELNQSDWNKIYILIEEKRRQQKTPDPINLERLLEQQGFSLDIRNVDFSETKNLTQLSFRNLRFKSCNFSETNFQGSFFWQVSAYSCQFIKAKWNDSIIQDSSFLQCDFTEAEIILSGISDTSITDSNLSFGRWNSSILVGLFILRGKLIETSFVNTTVQNCFVSSSDLSYSCWNSAILNETFILHGKLLETSFLNASVQGSFIVDSDLTDCLLLNSKKKFIIEGGKPHSITRAIVGLTWDFHGAGFFTPMIAEALRDNGMIPLKIEREPKNIDVELLAQEVQNGIASIRNFSRKKILSIPAELLRQCSPNSEIEKVKKNAVLTLKYCSGLALPGGADLQPEFYGAEKAIETRCDADYRRSIVEFALLYQARKIKIPTMGTCRGAQLINIYLGGTLKQTIDPIHSSKNAQEMVFSESSRKEEIQALLKGNILASISAHHQAIDQVGVGLEIVLEYEGIPKLLLTQDNLFIVCQIHPEAYIDAERDGENGRALYQLFLESIHQFSITSDKK